MLRFTHVPGNPLITSSKGRDSSLPSEAGQEGFRHRFDLMSQAFSSGGLIFMLQSVSSV